MVTTYVGPLARYPARISFAAFAGLIVVGAALLLLPVSQRADRPPLSILDALFTATSATCVTGLTVRPTTDLTFFGQAVVLMLIQVGGLGIMTVATYAMAFLGGEANLRQQLLIAETLGGGTDLRSILRNVLRTTFLIEACGALLLSVRTMRDLPPLEGLWEATFHSVSAFCNAGFALYADNVMRYRHDVLVNLTLSALVILGGLGYPLLLEIARRSRGSWRDIWPNLSLHARLMLLGTTALLVLGTVGTWLLESNGAFADAPWWERLLAAWFHSVSCRTAGFNTVDIGQMRNATLFVSILLMLIGAGPCSTAGGFKVSTFAVLVCRTWKSFRGHPSLNMFRRTIPEKVVHRAMATAFAFGVVVIGGTMLVLLFEEARTRQWSQRLFVDVLFECVSALCTVGLSTGATDKLAEASRVVLIVLMFVGRLGPFSVALALSHAEQDREFEYAYEEPLLG